MKRYTVESDGMMMEQPGGEWFRYEDAKAWAQQEYATQRKKREEAIADRDLRRKEVVALAERLTEATALLEQAQRKGPARGDGALNGDIKAFLSRDPAPAAEQDTGAVSRSYHDQLQRSLERQRDAAESRLAEATALLSSIAEIVCEWLRKESGAGACMDRIETVLCVEVAQALSRAPASAAGCAAPGFCGQSHAPCGMPGCAETRAALGASRAQIEAISVDRRTALNQLESSEAECARLRDTIALQDAVLQASEKRHRATQWVWATAILREWRIAGFNLERYLVDNAIPGPVAALVRKYAGHPVGACDRCGKTAPLAMDNSPGWVGTMRCARGCEPEEPTVLASSGAMVCTPEERAVLDAADTWERERSDGYGSLQAEYDADDALIAAVRASRAAKGGNGGSDE